MADIPWEAERPRSSSLDVSKAKSTLDNKPLELTDTLKKLKNEKIKNSKKSCEEGVLQ